MITGASVTIAKDGAILITIGKVGLLKLKPLGVSVGLGEITISGTLENNQLFRAELPCGETEINAFHATNDITLIEVDEIGLVMHENVRKN